MTTPDMRHYGNRCRVVTYPSNALASVTSHLEEHMHHEDAEDLALTIVLEVTQAVDRLRQHEAEEGG